MNPQITFSVLVCIGLLLTNAQTSAAKNEVAFGKLEEAFVAGMDGKRSVDRAEELFNQARSLGIDEQRVEYSRGLVLLKNLRKDEAIKAFEAASGGGDGAYLPAWRARIWARVITKSLPVALSDAESLAEILKRRNPNADGEEPQIAQWLGELLVAVEQTSKKDSELAAIQSTLDEIESTLADTDLAQPFKDGRAEALDRLEKHITMAEEAAANRKKRDLQKNEATKKRLEGQLKTFARDIEDTDLEKQDARAWLDETLKRADKEITRVEREIALLDKQAKLLNQSVNSLMGQLAWLQAFIQNGGRRLNQQNSALTPGGGFVVGVSPEQALLRTQFQLGQAQFEWTRVTGEADALTRKAQAIEQSKYRAIQKFERATGQISKKKADLKKWNRRLAAQERKTTEMRKKLADKAVRPKPPTFRALLRFDVAYERERVLASLR